MKLLLLLLGFTFSINCSAQVDSLRVRVYSDFINAHIQKYDSIFESKTKSIFISNINKFQSTIDLSYLMDYLNGNIQNNEIYKEVVKEGDPTQYFDMPPTFGLGKQLKNDRELGELIVALLENREDDVVDLAEIKTNYETRYIKNSKRYFKMGWSKFHKKFENNYGIIQLSNIKFNKNQDRAIFYVEEYRGSLNASGDIIVMKKVNNKWLVDIFISQWIS